MIAGTALVAAAALAVASCQSATPSAQSAALEQRIAASQGAEVSRICFTNTLQGWRELKRDALLVRTTGDDWFKVDLAGSCDADWAGGTLAVMSRTSASSCLSPGDRVQAQNLTFSSCTIDAIYEWNEKKP